MTVLYIMHIQVQRAQWWATRTDRDKEKMRVKITVVGERRSRYFWLLVLITWSFSNDSVMRRIITFVLAWETKLIILLLGEPTPESTRPHRCPWPRLGWNLLSIITKNNKIEIFWLRLMAAIYQLYILASSVFSWAHLAQHVLSITGS